jgi:hypothetical protein
MKVGVLKLLLPLALLTSAASSDAQQPGGVTMAVVSGSLQDLVRKPIVLRGTLGDDKIQLSLRPKVDEDGLEGQYFIFGQGSQILLAGEVDQNDLMMEESHNGKDVSGQWEGSFKNGVLSGTWSTLDGSVTKPFSLKTGLQ